MNISPFIFIHTLKMISVLVNQSYNVFLGIKFFLTHNKLYFIIILNNIIITKLHYFIIIFNHIGN